MKGTVRSLSMSICSYVCRKIPILIVCLDLHTRITKLVPITLAARSES
jgi:hypothetical protein